MSVDEQDYRQQLEPFRRELHAHCYRMLGSIQDAEDAAQETLLKAWRGLERFEGRSSLRSWLYTIATNVCLRMIERRPARVLPIDYGPPADPHVPIGPPLVESIWIDPYPDGQWGIGEGLAGPEARYEQREAVELAFIWTHSTTPRRSSSSGCPSAHNHPWPHINARKSTSLRLHAPVMLDQADHHGARSSDRQRDGTVAHDPGGDCRAITGREPASLPRTQGDRHGPVAGPRAEATS